MDVFRFDKKEVIGFHVNIFSDVQNSLYKQLY